MYLIGAGAYRRPMTWFLPLALTLVLADLGPRPPQPVDYFRSFTRLVEAKSWKAVADFVRPGSKFPIGIEGPDRHERKTYTYEDVLAGTVPFPVCDREYRCAETTPTHRVGCVCLRGRDAISFQFVSDEGFHDLPPLILVSITERLGVVELPAPPKPPN